MAGPTQRAGESASPVRTTIEKALQQPIELSCFAEMQKSRVEPRINFVPVVTDS